MSIPVEVERPRIVIIADAGPLRDQLTDALIQHQFDVVRQLTLSDYRPQTISPQQAEMLLVDLHESDEAELDLNVIDALMEENNFLVLFHDSASSLSMKGWEKKLVKKILSLYQKNRTTEQPVIQDMTGSQQEEAFKSVPINKKIGELLREVSKLTQTDLDQAMRAKSGDEMLGQYLLVQELVTEEDIARALALQMGLKVAKATDYPVEPILEEQIAQKFLHENKVIPLSVRQQVLTIATMKPEDLFITDSLQMLTGYEIVTKVAITAEYDSAYERLYGAGKSTMDQIVDDFSDGDALDDVEQLMDMASEAPIIRLVSLITQRAIEARASDIHIEPFENELKVRYRIDGVLQDVESPPSYSSAAVISRIKIMAKLNIAERRLPQDGRVKLRVNGKEVDLRVSTIPTMYGESVVMRILVNENVVMDFDTLGFVGEPLTHFLKILMQPNGILLVTGPTGSGKTTTLYTALNKLNLPGRKIITVEDPVEYQLDGVNQIQVKAKIGLTFASALRSIVRQDPDVIMIGEMRDSETAQIAVQSALTGHMVLSTLHTNDAPSSLTRLMDMGVEDYLITSSVNGVLAQRLVRRLCPHCREQFEASREVVNEFKLENYTDQRPVCLFRPKGCERCGNTGYHGRSIIVQMMIMSDPIRKLVMKHADASEIGATALGENMETLLQDGLWKSLQGITTIEEVMRVTHDISG